ncbi:MAG TPA: enoyl-CoA hydratase [Marinobacter hydrocarbonoclasticus]|uniref:enoyl-CoA hydratase n=1 Tax=Marinobacter TaxID=2742 RepID=UPI000C89F8F7|nr:MULTISPECIES: enoyl-CoA hydratase [unclassified Marinobacter]MAC22254.1 enoyl-CoA hydratase [Marinobacter sp.]HCR45434.1 enoyl-CoA hydratase [Marinobacter nauticus]|tara:strand:- start:4374 stop:5165 length:792 start_codon:yes stop_codon:yes gene_type:complete
MTAASDELVRVHTENGVATVTLNQPERRNSLSMALLEALSEVLEQIAGDGSVRVVVLAAAGKVFCAGHDLREMREQFDSHDFQLRLFRQCSKVMQQIVNLPKPVIARVAGVATAAGCQLVASCDLAVAEKGARFATPGVNIGLFCSTPMVALSRNVSRKHAMEMLLTGELIDAARAEQIGLINRAVEPEALDETVYGMATTIAAKSGHTLKIGKEAFYKQLEMPLAHAYDYTANVMAENMQANDAREGISAFLDKRDPDWQHK